MFRQIAVREDDREYQLNLCRQNPNKHFLLDKFNFVTYSEINPNNEVRGFEKKCRSIT